MPDITDQFHGFVQANPPPPTSKTPIPDREWREKGDYDLFTKEAYRVYQHVDGLTHFLKMIRRVYIQDQPDKKKKKKKKSKRRRVQDDGDDKEFDLFAQFPSHVTHLTDQERDDIDFQAKLVLRRCMDRVKDMEEAERLRVDSVQSKKQGWKRLLSSHLDATQDTLAMHRSNMLWLLNKRLMDVSRLQKDQQQIRLERVLSKSENHLFSSQSRAMQLRQPQPHDDDDDDPLAELSAEQVQLLEKENETMLEEMNSTLNEVHQAEKALMEISGLQTQLANHLAVQTLQTDQLYGDSLATNERMEQGNVQLIKAKERNKGTRKFMILFLFGASLVLLFLDWFS
ncbi:hypothetical protein BC940DRAFT_238735 [Gongronella butleri]|nr:hypothetical protein BC940DRAFT_238735 [Gongronella butleri]